MGETVPVNVAKTDLMNIYMTIFRHQLTEEDLLEEEDDGQTCGQTTGGGTIPPQWYLSPSLQTLHNLSNYFVHEM